MIHERNFFLQTIFLIYGPQVASAISKDAKTVPTLNLKTSLVGSGPLIVKRSSQPTAYQPDGATTRGLKPDIRNKGNPTMLNLILTVPLNLVCPFLITSTMMALLGMMLRVITKNLSSVKIPKNYWTTWHPRIKVYACNCTY